MNGLGMSWTDPVRKMTPYGERLVSEAAPTPQFWELWRADKEGLKAAGYAVSKIGQNFRVFRYQNLTEEIQQEKAEKRERSRASTADVDIVAPPGLSYLPYQRAGIAYGAARDAVLIADEMGLGKTIQGIGIANATDARTILVICPASLKLNWERELGKWLVRKDLSIGIAKTGKHFPDTDVVIINYDILRKFRNDLRAQTWDLLIADECHYLKNARAQRTIEVVGGGRGDSKVGQIPAKRRVLLTGTPIVNRPMELWPLIHYLDPVTWKNFMTFAKRYCAAHHNGFGWDFGGASNLQELQDRLREDIMIRRLKADVLTDLPPKRRQIIALEPDAEQRKVIEKERAAEARHAAELERLTVAAELAKAGTEEEYKEAVEALNNFQVLAFTDMANARHETALAKLPLVIEHLQEIEDKVVVMAHHKDVVAGIKEAFGEACVTLTGETPMDQRQAAVDRFQTDPACRIFVGSIRAAGVGLTLTAASHVVFAELDWTPGAMSQAEDRCHRIGQRNSVLVQHLVLDGSLDARIAQTLVSKQEVADHALDKTGGHVEQIQERELEAIAAELPVREEQEPATRKAPRKDILELAEKLTDAQVEAIHTGLRIVAGMDSDHAMIQNDIGFSRIDGTIGHSLANCPRLTKKQAALGYRLVNKYRRQLPADLVAAAKGEAA